MLRRFFYFIVALLAAYSCADTEEPQQDENFNGGDSAKIQADLPDGIPVVYITTADARPVVSKKEYIQGNIHITCPTNPIHDLRETTIKIRGRGYSTWLAPQKPYKIKFEKKTSLLGMPAGKSWVLLANYLDRTKLRTDIAFHLGQMSVLEWTPHGRFVDLYINEVYQGNYYLCEHISISKNRVNVGDDGYILEVDQKSHLDSSDVYFETPHHYFNIKDPDVLYESTQYDWIVSTINSIEETLFSPDFLDAEKGYHKCVDLNSFADWYIINELTKNNDAIFWSSCYMNIVPNGKLKMGPLWDFDLAFGNYSENKMYDPSSFWVRQASWIRRMWEDPEFVSLVRQRFDYFKSRMDEIYTLIDEDANLIKTSVNKDDEVWNTMTRNIGVTYYIWGSFEAEVEWVKYFLRQRMAWLDEHIPTRQRFFHHACYPITDQPVTIRCKT